MNYRHEWMSFRVVRMFLVIWSVMVGGLAAADTGRVLDEDSGSPITNAVAVVWWTRLIEAGTPRERSECIAIRTVAVTKAGIFEMPALRSQPSDPSVQRHIYAFKAGYREHPRSYDPKALQADMFYLQQDDLPDEMRMDYLISVLAKLECPQQSARKVVLKTLFRSIYGEAQGLRNKNVKQQHGLDLIERRIAYAWSDEREKQPHDKMARYFRDSVARELTE